MQSEGNLTNKKTRKMAEKLNIRMAVEDNTGLLDFLLIEKLKKYYGTEHARQEMDDVFVIQFEDARSNKIIWSYAERVPDTQQRKFEMEYKGLFIYEAKP